MAPSFKQFIQASESSNKGDLEAKIQNLIDNSDLIMFFEKKDDIYGTDELGRMTFAQMKNPSKELTDDWGDDATFMARNLSNVLRGGGIETVVSKDELKGIKIIDSDTASKKLLRQALSSKHHPKDQEIQIISVKR